MRTAITVQAAVFKKAERLARWMKKSRSELYSEAVVEYIARHYNDEITGSINRMLDDPEAADPEMDSFVAAAARRTLERSEW
jgi:predicted transcriptional regulator